MGAFASVWHTIAYVVAFWYTKFFGWWRSKSPKRFWMDRLRSVTTYEDWEAAALQLDKLYGFDLWRETSASKYYDWALIKDRLQLLHDTRVDPARHHRLPNLIRSGLDEKAIQAILKKEKIAAEDKEKDKDKGKEIVRGKERATYTRMARRHLSIETLNVYHIDYELDAHDPNYLLIKRWVPEEEQDHLWRHTRMIRERRMTETTTNVNQKLVVKVEDGHHHHHHKKSKEDFIFVKKKRERSRSPSLLMYLAGAQPR
jgi:hypothetical protein